MCLDILQDIFQNDGMSCFPGNAYIGILGGIGVGFSAQYGWQAVFNTFGALAIAAETYGCLLYTSQETAESSRKARSMKMPRAWSLKFIRLRRCV